MVEIFADRLAAEAQLLGLEIEEQGRRQGDGTAFDRHQAHLVAKAGTHR